MTSVPVRYISAPSLRKCLEALFREGYFPDGACYSDQYPAESITEEPAVEITPRNLAEFNEETLVEMFSQAEHCFFFDAVSNRMPLSIRPVTFRSTGDQRSVELLIEYADETTETDDVEAQSVSEEASYWWYTEPYTSGSGSVPFKRRTHLKLTNHLYVNINPMLELLQRAHHAILQIYHQSSREELNRAAETKDDMSPLTAADLASHNILVDGLAKITPGIPVVSEENCDEISRETRMSYDYYWLIDPLDGTKEFLKKNGEFTVNIALMRGSEVEFGLVGWPVAGWAYYAYRGDGAYRQKLPEHAFQPYTAGAGNGPRLLQASQFRWNGPQIRAAVSNSHLNSRTQEWLETYLTNPKLIRAGSALKILMLAEGRADVYPRLNATMEWDTAAAQIILEEAGGKVMIWDEENQRISDQPVTYQKRNLGNPDFVAFGQVIQYLPDAS